MNEDSVNNITSYFNEMRSQQLRGGNFGGPGHMTNISQSGHLSFNQQIINQKVGQQHQTSSIIDGQSSANAAMDRNMLGTINTNNAQTISNEALNQVNQGLRPDLEDDDNVLGEDRGFQEELNQRE